MNLNSDAGLVLFLVIVTSLMMTILVLARAFTVLGLVKKWLRLRVNL